MRFVPHTRAAGILWSELQRSLAEHGADPAVRAKLGDAIEAYLERHENHETTTADLTERLTAHGVDLGQAVVDGRADDATRLRDEMIAAGAAHPQAAIWTAAAHSLHGAGGAPLDHYRNWKDAPGKTTHDKMQFGMIDATIAPDATIGILGDWGTGDPDAEALLRELVTDHAPDLILHLGDIYNCCYEWEAKKHFLDVIERVYGTETPPPILTLAGNHDYWGHGGQGFYWLIDHVNAAHGSTWHQKASYLCLRTTDDSWQFLGADTGLQDGVKGEHNENPGLQTDEYAWHIDKIERFKRKGERRTVFMTHHPLVSATRDLSTGSHVNSHLVKHLGPYLKDEIGLWLWGHNHWFIPYVDDLSISDPSTGKTRTLRKGRLLGGSGRHDGHNANSVLNYRNGDAVMTHTVNGKEVFVLPDYNNIVYKSQRKDPTHGPKLPNHSYAVMKLGTGTTGDNATIAYYQRPSWHAWQASPIEQLPAGQKRILLTEDVL